jgi:hypothetical protein
LKWLGGLLIEPDVANDLAFEIGDGGEDAAIDEVLWVEKLSRITCTWRVADCVATTPSKNVTNSWLVCRGAV